MSHKKQFKKKKMIPQKLEMNMVMKSKTSFSKTANKRIHSIFKQKLQPKKKKHNITFQKIEKTQFCSLKRAINPENKHS